MHAASRLTTNARHHALSICFALSSVTHQAVILGAPYLRSASYRALPSPQCRAPPRHVSEVAFGELSSAVAENAAAADVLYSSGQTAPPEPIRLAASLILHGPTGGLHRDRCPRSK